MYIQWRSYFHDNKSRLMNFNTVVHGSARDVWETEWDHICCSKHVLAATLCNHRLEASCNTYEERSWWVIAISKYTGSQCLLHNLIPAPFLSEQSQNTGLQICRTDMFTAYQEPMCIVSQQILRRFTQWQIMVYLSLRQGICTFSLAHTK